MQPLYYELSVLAKAVHFKNLSAAAVHVGLSQPQLSRIIGRLEDELKVILLDRSARRKSGWTSTALQIAKIFEQNSSRMFGEILNATDRDSMDELHIGTLEGLSHVAMRICQTCFEKMGIRKINLDIFDLSELEANFLSGDLDLVFTSKHPGRQKFKNHAEIGYQDFNWVKSNNDFGVYSTFEFQKAPTKETAQFNHLLVSNSLAVKKDWLNEFGGTGMLPSEPRRTKDSQSKLILLIASDLLSPPLWERIRNASLSV